MGRHWADILGLTEGVSVGTVRWSDSSAPALAPFAPGILLTAQLRRCTMRLLWGILLEVPRCSALSFVSLPGVLEVLSGTMGSLLWCWVIVLQLLPG